jgi:hypothetical protein
VLDSRAQGEFVNLTEVNHIVAFALFYTCLARLSPGLIERVSFRISSKTDLLQLKSFAPQVRSCHEIGPMIVLLEMARMIPDYI